jgi:hypothetical protein
MAERTRYQEATNRLMFRLREAEVKRQLGTRLNRSEGYQLAQDILEQIDNVDITSVMVALGIVLSVVEEASPETNSGIMPSTLLQSGLKAYALLLNHEDEPATLVH